MSAQEVIEDGFTKPQTISSSLVCGQCKIVNVHPTASVSSMLKQHKNPNENKEIYICRYKLVRQTNYVLVPVSMSIKTAAPVNAPRELRERNDNVRYADEQDRYDSDDPLAPQHYEPLDMEVISSDTNDSNEENRRVTPIKLSVSRTPKTAKYASAIQGSPKVVQMDDDEEVSPNKRCRRHDGDDRIQLNKATETANKVRKNFNTSFGMHEDHDETIESDDGAGGVYTSMMCNFSLKMKISK